MRAGKWPPNTQRNPFALVLKRSTACCACRSLSNSRRAAAAGERSAACSRGDFLELPFETIWELRVGVDLLDVVVLLERVEERRDRPRDVQRYGDVVERDVLDAGRK